MNNFTFDTSRFAIANPDLVYKLNKEMHSNGLGFQGLGNIKILGNVAQAIVNHTGKVYNNLKLLNDYMFSGGLVKEKTNNKQREDIYKWLTNVTNDNKFYTRLQEVITSFQKQEGEVSIRKTKYEVVK